MNSVDVELIKVLVREIDPEKLIEFQASELAMNRVAELIVKQKGWGGRDGRVKSVHAH